MRRFELVHDYHRDEHLNYTYTGVERSAD